MSIINNWQALIKPSKLKLISDEDTQYKATLIAEPLERGFGLTPVSYTHLTLPTKNEV